MGDFSYFLKNAIISGTLVGLIMLFLKKKYEKLGGLLYGAIPFGFIYIMIATYCSSINRKDKFNKLHIFSKFATIGLSFSFLYIILYYLSLKYRNNFILSTCLFFIGIIISIPLIIKIYNW